MIRQGIEDDLPEVVKLVRAVVKRMEQRGSNQWDATYPTRADYLKDINRNELYVYVEQDRLVGLFTLSSRGHKEYQFINWTSEKPAWTLKRLAIEPDFHGQGRANKLLEFAEKLAIQSGIYRLNTDTYSDNLVARKLFERHGYQLVDQQMDPQKGLPLLYYEKIIEGGTTVDAERRASQSLDSKTKNSRSG